MELSTRTIKNILHYYDAQNCSLLASTIEFFWHIEISTHGNPKGVFHATSIPLGTTHDLLDILYSCLGHHRSRGFQVSAILILTHTKIRRYLCTQSQSFCIQLEILK